MQSFQVDIAHDCKGQVHHPENRSGNCEEREGRASSDGGHQSTPEDLPHLVDAQGNLLRTKPKDWNEIKNNKFMIINGQHSIQASKEL